MLSPLDVLKGFINLKSYFTWVMMAMVVWSGFSFFKKRSIPPSWSKHITTFFIILGVFSLLYFCCFRTKEPSSKYYGQLIGKIDQAIDKYGDTINNYNGLKQDWEKELEKCETELKDLYEQKDLTQEAKEKIKEALEKNEAKIKEIKAKMSENDKNITILKGKLVQLEKDKETKEKEIKEKERQKELASPDDKIRLQAEIDKLRDEISKIVGEIGKIKVQIKNLETDQKYYQNMLNRTEKLKKDLEKRFEILTNDEKSIFKQIQSAEERRIEIQKEIEEVDKKLKEINLEKELYQALKLKYREMYNRMITYEKEHEVSAGNITKWVFKGFDKITDLFPAKYGLKILGKTVTFTRNFAQGMSKATLVLHEGHRLWHLYNEVVNENKEHSPMITKEALEMYTQDIDRDLAKLEANYKDYEKKIADYKIRLNQDNLKNECINSEKLNESIKKEFVTWINEYETIVKELEKGRDKASDTDELYEDKAKLEEELNNKRENVDIIKEQLKQKNPNYARAQQRLQAKRVGKIPEIISLTN
ncbi:MAG: DNA double-strand break repair protein Rad50 [Candidatus Phytoplasma stylosanthis]|nr:DNA double-strand break repair protein Rad50 [Candidatus Phytoplasma stylosanthis]